MYQQLEAFRILIIEDNRGDFILIQEYFREEIKNPELIHVTNFNKAREILIEDKNFNAILLDLSLPDARGEDLVKDIVKFADQIPVIVLTGYEDKDFGIKTLALGISDYLFKDELSPSILSKSLVYGMERKRIGNQLKEAERERLKYEKEITKAVIIAQERERKEIGAELHDNVNQLLAASKLNLSLARDEEISEKALEWVCNAEIYIENALKDIRKLSHRLTPNSFEDISLIVAIEKLLHSININRMFEIVFQQNNFNEKLVSEDLKLNLYRILQEQVKNILNYAKATAIEVSLTMDQELLKMRVYDNGCGFDVDKVQRGIGLSNIKQRAELFMGVMIINSLPGEGCEMMIEIPVTKQF